MNITKRLTLFTFLILSSFYAQATEPLIVAHRGTSGTAPENTIPAFELAWKDGADAIEADFLLTKDGHIVCIHDKNTKRVAGTKLGVNHSTLSELRKLDVGSWKHMRYKGTKIPTITEVFATVPEGKKIYIEIKDEAVIIPQLLKDIENSGLSNDQLVIICFKPHVLKELKKKSPKLKTIWLCNIRNNKQGNQQPSNESVFNTLKRINADGISTSAKVVGEDFIKECKSKGYEHHVWTIDDPKKALQFKQWGTLSITTNLPKVIREAIIPSENE